MKLIEESLLLVIGALGARHQANEHPHAQNVAADHGLIQRVGHLHDNSNPMTGQAAEGSVDLVKQTGNLFTIESR